MKFNLKHLPAALLLAGLSPLTAQAVVLPIIADTHVAATNAGGSVIVNINSQSKALLNFNTSTLPSGITSHDIAKATLVFYVKTVPTSGKLQISPIEGAWNESTVTLNNAPPTRSSQQTSTTISSSNTYFAVDVTTSVMDWVDFPTTTKGLMLEPAGLTPSTSLTIDSKEATLTSHPAYIEIALKGPAGPAGARGATGLKGSAGVAGMIGLKGLTGATGAASTVAGPKGATGAMPVGHAAGDMQYWNGSAWINIAAGTTYATFKICKGVPTWTTNNCGALKIGDTGPAGGKVFYLSDTIGLHGLEAAPVDQSTSGLKWGCDGINVVGGTSTAVGTGKANTAAINAQCGNGTAAKIAASYSLNGFTDWYLPSKDELNLLYAQKAVVGGFASTFYWSSSENISNYAWTQYFVYGGQDYGSKSNPLWVRAVRAF